MTTVQQQMKNLRKQAEGTQKEYDHYTHERGLKRERLAEIVDEYNEQRIELVKEGLSARDLDWCTYCKQATPKNTFSLMFVTGSYEFTSGYGQSYFGYRDFAELHRACLACKARMQERHGFVGEYSSLGGGQEKFFAFGVEKKEDGYYAIKFGQSVKLAEGCEEKLFWDPPDKLIEQLAKEWRLPGKMNMNREGNLELPE